MKCMSFARPLQLCTRNADIILLADLGREVAFYITSYFYFSVTANCIVDERKLGIITGHCVSQ